MSRAKWKGVFISTHLLENRKNFKKRGPKKIYTRNSTVPISCINKRFLLYNGLKFNAITVRKQHIGFKFGEFSYTRKSKERKNFKKTVKSSTKNIKK